MRPALLIALAALAFTTVGKCFSQQTPQSDQREAEAVVIKLYKQIVFRKPLGLPRRRELEAIRRLLSQELIERMRVATECEKDYFRQYPISDPNDPNALILKAPFAWGEAGLFSGGNEQADPSWFALNRAVRQKDGSYEVHVNLKWWAELDKFPRPRGPQYDWTWEVVVFVIREGDHDAVDDVFYPKVYPDNAGPRYPTVEDIRLSQLLNVGCKDGRWVGYPSQKSP